MDDNHDRCCHSGSDRDKGNPLATFLNTDGVAFNDYCEPDGTAECGFEDRTTGEELGGQVAWDMATLRKLAERLPTKIREDQLAAFQI